MLPAEKVTHAARGAFALDPRKRYLARPGPPADVPEVALARPRQPLVLEAFYSGQKRAVLRVAPCVRTIWRAGEHMGEVRRLMLVRGQALPLADGAAFTLQTQACQGEARPAIFAHPPWQGASAGGVTVGEFRVALPQAKPLYLRFATGLADVAHDPTLVNIGDGVTFTVSVNGRRIFQKHQRRNGGWREHKVRLDEHAGRMVLLRLATGSGRAIRRTIGRSGMMCG
jgi:hypothetical protein